MKLPVVMLTRYPQNWSQDLQALLEKMGDFEFVVSANPSTDGRIFFVDPEFVGEVDRRGKVVFLIAPESTTDYEERVDDVLLTPFRELEVVSKLRLVQRVLDWEEVSQLNESFTEIIGHLREDLQLAERIQSSRLKPRFPKVKGVQIRSRYLAGMRSGGDFLDVAEGNKGRQISLLLSDASNYGLASALMTAMMKLAFRLTREQAGSTLKTVQAIYEEIRVALAGEDHLSLFYGIVDRSTRWLTFTHVGTSGVFHAPIGKPFELLPSQGKVLTAKSGVRVKREGRKKLDPEDRLVLVSDGFVEKVGGVKKTLAFLNQDPSRDPNEILNELAYQVKKDLSEDDFPEQDCTAAVVDINSNVIPLKRRA